MNRPPVDASAFRTVMRHYPTGVTVVTSLREGEPRGMTLNAFSSVAVDPPLLLICVNREARSYLYIATSRIFCVNLLSAGQRELAERFSGKIREHQFEGVPFEVDVTGAPVIPGTIGHFDCEVAEEHHAGSHSIIIGRVVGCAARTGTPLGYFNGGYHDFGMRVE
ncbi:MAG: flavin reductase family protein [Candidatus Eremiobacteraeota bacterium]|nr:flavin reductase family protein [Candidatus Eremiobacteraeota bacterium]